MSAAVGWSIVALAGTLAASSARAEPAPSARAEEPSADDFGGFAGAGPEADAHADPFEGAQPDVMTEPIPVPPHVPRRGRGALVAGGIVLGLGVAGRIAIEVFWAVPARLGADEPFGEWSIPGIAFTPTFSNVFVLSGLIATGIGARRHGAWRVASGHRRPDPVRVRRNRRLGWGLLGGGLTLWAVTRAAALPVLRACETNGCAYGYVESTFWMSLGAVVPGVVMAGLGAGERRQAGTLSLTPMVSPGARGLALGGRF